jgi:hypothetical protein
MILLLQNETIVVLGGVHALVLLLINFFILSKINSKPGGGNSSIQIPIRSSHLVVTGSSNSKPGSGTDVNLTFQNETSRSGTKVPLAWK